MRRVTRRQHHHPVARLDHREEEVPKRFIEPARREDLLGAQVAISARDRVPQIHGAMPAGIVEVKGVENAFRLGRDVDQLFRCDRLGIGGAEIVIGGHRRWTVEEFLKGLMTAHARLPEWWSRSVSRKLRCLNRRVAEPEERLAE